MGTTVFARVRTATSSVEADRMISSLRGAGLHPVDLSMSADCSLQGNAVGFPIQVPIEEAVAARELLDACDELNDASR
jgi:hypothetical protein